MTNTPESASNYGDAGNKRKRSAEGANVLSESF